ncbi:alkaline phosphatase family protein, partial [Burkholderia territorii]|uniref:alkaline phosphatase family protein n=1 Tax=Burkholderia territorii TaxID=1503055 RepID=UPI00244572B5
GTGTGVADTRFPANLPNGPFQISKYVPYAQEITQLEPFGLTLFTMTGDPVHRFFQMWQQTGGDNSKHDMFTWVATTVGQGGDTSGITPSNPSQGGELMGFMNMSTGDAPYFQSLAQTYAISDKYRQSIMGGTGANFFSIATADSPFFNNAGAVATPPANQIENPNP